MAIKYRGDGSAQEINLVLYGDGTTSSAKVNLTKAPFVINFKGKAPTLAYLVGEKSTSATTYPDLTDVTVDSAGILKLKFESALPKTDFSAPDEVGNPSSGINLVIRFIYS